MLPFVVLSCPRLSQVVLGCVTYHEPDLASNEVKGAILIGPVTFNGSLIDFNGTNQNCSLINGTNQNPLYLFEFRG